MKIKRNKLNKYMKNQLFLVIVSKQDVKRCTVNAWQKDNYVLHYAIVIIVIIEK